MPIDRDHDDERKARVAALIREARDLRARSEQALTRARELTVQSVALVQHEEFRQQREALLRSAREALNRSAVPANAILRLPSTPRKKSA